MSAHPPRVASCTRRPAMPAAATTSTVLSWLTTVDHKRIGILYGVTAFAFFLLGGIEALVIRLQLAVPNNTVVSAQPSTRCSRCTAPR